MIADARRSLKALAQAGSVGLTGAEAFGLGYRKARWEYFFARNLRSWGMLTVVTGTDKDRTMRLVWNSAAGKPWESDLELAKLLWPGTTRRAYGQNEQQLPLAAPSPSEPPPPEAEAADEEDAGAEAEPDPEPAPAARPPSLPPPSLPPDLTDGTAPTEEMLVAALNMLDVLLQNVVYMRARLDALAEVWK